jgi:hypothetical protein
MMRLIPTSVAVGKAKPRHCGVPGRARAPCAPTLLTLVESPSTLGYARGGSSNAFCGNSSSLVESVPRAIPRERRWSQRHRNASLAQSVERETLNLKVAGSTPAWGCVKSSFAHGGGA